jgi:hypothetical protein
LPRMLAIKKAPCNLHGAFFSTSARDLAGQAVAVGGHGQNQGVDNGQVAGGLVAVLLAVEQLVGAVGDAAAAQVRDAGKLACAPTPV